MTKCVWPVNPEERLCKFCKLTMCDDRDYTNSRKYGTVTPTMRAMKVGEKAEFGAEKYGAVRVAMSRLSPMRFSMFFKGNCLVVEKIS